MNEYRLKSGKIEKAVVGAYKKVEDTVVNGYKKIERAFTEKFLHADGSLKTDGMADKASFAYQRVEDTVVGAYRKIENAFVDAFLDKSREKKV